MSDAERSTGDERRGSPRLMIGALILVVLGSGWLLVGLLAFPAGDGWGYDYLAYRDAAERLVQTGSLYQAETLDGPYRPGPYGLYMYAPPLGVVMVPLAGLPADVGIVGWFLIHVVALALACALLPVRVPLRLAAFGLGALSYAVTRDIVLGNVSVLLLLPMAIAWRWLDRPVGSVAQALAIAIRPTLGIVLVWQLLRHCWRAVAWTLAAGLALVLATLPFVGIDGYLEYLAVLRNLTGVTGVVNNFDISSTLVLLGIGEDLAAAGLLAGYALAVAALLLSLRRDGELGFIVALGASLLLSPLLWDHYLALLMLPAAFLAQRWHPLWLGLPLLTWLPKETYPLLVLAALWLPFLAPRTEPSPLDREQPTPGAVARRALA